MRFNLLSPSSLFLVLTLGATTNALANNDSQYPNVKFSGYLSLIGGRVIDGHDTRFSYNRALQDCPCYIADWTNSAVYNSDWSFDQESRIGGQMVVNIAEALSFTTQVIVRAVETDPEWAWGYFNYQLNDHWSIQLGRKRIPNFYYSDFQDIGIAYPWLNVPPTLYGWEVTHYDGGAVRYHTYISGYNISTSVFGGSGEVEDSRYNRLSYSYPGDERDARVEWNNLGGIDLEINKGIWTMRLMHLQTNGQVVYEDGSTGHKNDISIVGMANNFDFGDFFILSELNKTWRRDDDPDDDPPIYSGSLGAGYRIEQWTLFANYGHLKAEIYDYTIKNPSLTLRYDLDKHSAIKTQFDYWGGDPQAAYTGDATVFRIGYERTF